ncbi:MAG: hypothetical protein ACFFEN_05755 [Candidatus Thorarchaeota archaeon]
MKDRFAHENKVILLSFYDNWDPEHIRSELIRQFEMQTRAYGYSRDGIILDPPPLVSISL